MWLFSRRECPWSGVESLTFSLPPLLRLLGPFVFGVAARELAADLRVETFPEAREVAGHLNGAVVWRQQMDDDRHSADTGRFLHAKEVLETRFDPWRLSFFVVDGNLAASGKTEALGSGLIEAGRPDCRDQVRGG